MPKLLWVALPLLLASSLVGLQVLRKRPLSKRALNMGSSLLLLAYVLTTAGLGIFWVANQQLPVFDWHYLFGYGTVLLVAVHLAFNFRIVWSYLRNRPLALSPSAGTPAARRGALGVLGWTLATGAAFALGMRHGRTELNLGPSGPAGTGATGAAAASGLARVEAFHAFSSQSRTHVLLRAPSSDWADPPPPFKRYAGKPRIALPAPGTKTAARFGSGALGTALWHTSGVTESRGGLALRAAPSSGALFSTELYVVSRALRDMDPGVWHYDPRAHALAQIGDARLGAAALDAADGPVFSGAAALIVATAVFARTGHKYRDRTYRYVLADLGHALENLRAAVAALGARSRFVSGFDESKLAAALGVDEAEEGVLAVLAVGAAEPSPACSSSFAPTAHWRVPERMPIAASPLPVTAAIHVATSLRRTPSQATPGQPATREDSMPAGAIALPPVRPEAANVVDVLDVIAARRSKRRFASTPLSLDAVGGVLQLTARVGPMLSAAVRINVVIHAVDGIAPGSYRYDAARHALLPRRSPSEPRTAARSAALDQDVVGDAAVVFVLSIDRAAFAEDPWGPARGYRHAFLEAGLVGERIYLNAALYELGVCAVGAFYDDEAAAWVAVDPAREWVVHLAAMGQPAG